MLMILAECSHTPVAEFARVSSHGELKLTKFYESTDDIKVNLIMFKWLMMANHVDATQWVYLLALQLTGKTQEAFAAMQTSAKKSTNRGSGAPPVGREKPTRNCKETRRPP